MGPRVWLHVSIRETAPLLGNRRAVAALAMIDRHAYGAATMTPDVPLGTLTSRRVRGRQVPRRRSPLRWRRTRCWLQRQIAIAG
ncbi:hypothetical protein QE361_001578 [Sphingomonas sp. SORGH_AS802]|uniref:hypothetical protein n=1 Tax=unclassified Sphingomonas TaxID=196159 RepID=UPI002855BC2A|nr:MULTISPECIES: hypothetical protein [unclassified Sphingomonas]MDR6127043.1 hypothetical protein [Sphingomonas sp. SORGH_AS_0438]MDR6134595.1 hypothetical protein [Sphingomonas sp. SORGH_AS_0802]